MIDTHAHLHFDNFTGEVPTILHRAHEADVTKIITVGVDTADSRKATELAGQYENVWSAVGIHPYGAAEAQQGISYLRDLASRRKVVAIGECGLDLYKAEASIEDQERALRAQIELAGELKLPLILHIREAFPDFFRIIKDYPEAKGVVHSFTGTASDMERIVAAGLHIALNGIITFTKDEEHLEAARQVPADRLILETDCPFLSPASVRGKTNEPANVVVIAEKVAELRGVSVDAVAQSTTENAERLFGI